MRTWTTIALLALLASAQGASARDRVPDRPPPKEAATKASNAEEAAAAISAARKKAERLEQARERRIRKSSRSICVGC